MSNLSDSGFEYPKRYSAITTLDTLTQTLLDSKQRELEHFLYGAPESFTPVWCNTGGATPLTFQFGVGRHNRIRGRQVLLSWIGQVNLSGGAAHVNLAIAIPKLLWPKAPVPAAATSVPAAGASGVFTSAHVFVARGAPALLDDRGVGAIASWVIDLGVEEFDAALASAGANSIVAGHIIYGLAS